MVVDLGPKTPSVAMITSRNTWGLGVWARPQVFAGGWCGTMEDGVVKHLGSACVDETPSVCARWRGTREDIVAKHLGS